MQTHLSAALLAAQETLLALRQQRQIQQRECGIAAASPPPIPSTTTIATLPAHLGWHSEAVSRHLRRLEPQPSPVLASPTHPITVISPVVLPAVTDSAPATFSLSADLALVLLQQNLVATGRIWFLLRHLDSMGRGWLVLPEVRAQLCQKDAPLQVCGWRQLRILLGQGEGIFWQRQGDKLWLRSLVKVAAACGVARLSGHPISLPIALLRQPIAEVKAHFYASFHSGRHREGQPIARATLSQLSGLSRQTQRHYEKRAGVRPQPNFALGPIATPETQEEMAWQHGHAAFVFTDAAGKHGAKGTRYVAWQLPNDYRGPHQRQSKHRHRRLNRRLADLQHQGTAGNGQHEKRFFADGSQASKGHGETRVYWRGRVSPKSGTIWYPLTNQPDQL